jgi:hypothetical protein
MTFGLAVFGATRTTNPAWVIFWISIALGGLASAAPVGWSLPSLIAPKGGAGGGGREAGSERVLYAGDDTVLVQASTVRTHRALSLLR